MGGLSGADVGMLAAAGAVVVFAMVYAWLRGGRRDSLERLALWAGAKGLEYVAAASEGVVASFVGEIDGRAVAVEVTRAPRGFGVDLPTKVTTVLVGGAGGAGGPGGPGGDAVCVLQPAAWVMDRDGRTAGEPVSSGDARFDEAWSARGDADVVAALVTPQLRASLLDADAEGLVIELSAGAVAIPMPGVCADPRELDRRLALALALMA